jgi:hypothetical protein
MKRQIWRHSCKQVCRNDRGNLTGESAGVGRLKADDDRPRVRQHPSGVAHLPVIAALIPVGFIHDSTSGTLRI